MELSDSSEEFQSVLGPMVEEARIEAAAAREKNLQAVLRWQKKQKELDDAHGKDMAAFSKAFPNDFVMALPSSALYQQRTDEIARQTLRLNEEYDRLYGGGLPIAMPDEIAQGKIYT
jgi:hypothetical protein